MKNIFSTYYFAFLRAKLSGNNKVLIDFYRKKGIKIGSGCSIFSNILTPEAYLVTIGNNVTIAPGCRLLTHDNSVSKVWPEYTDVFGRINIGDNCFIGADSIILPGVTLGDNCIVAAGRVVSISHPGGAVIAGNPARQITDIERYRDKVRPFCFSTRNMNEIDKKHAILTEARLIKK